jgi:hypothetical protein
MCFALSRGTTSSRARPSVWCRGPFGRRGYDVFHLRGVPLVQLRDYVKEIGPLAADAGQEEVRLSLGEPNGWSLGPEGWESHGHS